MKDTHKATVTRILPKLLINAIEGLPLSRIMKGKCYKLVSIVIKKAIQDGKDFMDYIPLATSYFEKTFGKRFNNQFFNLMKDSGILERNNICYEGTAYGYRICKDLLEGEWETVKYNEKFNDGTEVLNCLESQENLLSNENAKRYFHGFLNPNIQCDISPVSSVPFFPHISSSIFLPISTYLFSKDIVYDDLRSLSYNGDRIIEYFADKISSPSTLGLVVIEDITTRVIKVLFPKYGKERYIKFEDALTKAKDLRCDLIKDGDKYIITKLDEYYDRKKQNTLIYARWLLSGLMTGAFYASRNATNNRLDHNLTVASKDIMKIIPEDNELIEIDIRNSQFAIHSLWLKNIGLHEMYEDVFNYCTACAKGELYEYIATHLNTTREEAKRAMMSLSFSSRRNSTKEKKVLRVLFPNVVAQADEYKKKDGESPEFAVMLQRIESAIVIDRLYYELKRRGIFCLTKHDSLIVRKSQRSVVLDVIYSISKEIGLECTLNVDGDFIFTGT